MVAHTLVVSEVFGPTFQGEGPSTGRPATFIRLGGCNLHCTWCDTPYTWDATRHDLRAELTRRPVDELLTHAVTAGTRLAVITGGEPLLHQHQPGWRTLLDGLVDSGLDVEVETNATLTPDRHTAQAARFNVSPKLTHAGDPHSQRIRRPALDRFAALARENRAAFKFVAQSAADLREVDTLTAALHIPARAVWVMPQGTTAAEQLDALPALADATIRRGYNLTTRLHILTWADQRGR